MISLIVIYSLIFLCTALQAQLLKNIAVEKSYGGSDKLMPSGIIFKFYNGRKRIYEQKGVSNDSNTANYKEKMSYGVLRSRRLSEKLFEYDATFVFKGDHIHIYPSSQHTAGREEGQCENIMVESVAYKRCFQSLSSMVGDSYGVDVVHDDNQQQLTVEIFVHIDYSLYAKWLNFTKGDQPRALNAIKNYYSHIVNGVNANYERINRPDFAISVHLSTFFVETTFSLFVNETSTSTSLGHGEAMHTAKKWWAAQKYDHHDAAFFFTHINMGEALGVTDLLSICTLTPVMIAPHKNQLELTSTATHELGHMLGSMHDGSSNKCLKHSLYIMSPSLEDFNKNNVAHKFTFSPCSIAYFKLCIEQLNAINSNCLLNEAIGAQDLLMEHFHVGQSLSMHDQCKLLHGPSSYHCGGDDVCEALYCYNPLEKDCHKDRSQTAADGSQCGNNKWCVEGLCVPDARAPSSEKETCIYGEPTVQLDQEKLGAFTCNQLTEATADKCHLPFVHSLCCDTCPKFYKSDVVGCELGDKKKTCESQVISHPAICRLQKTATECCDSCAKHYKEADLGKFDSFLADIDCMDTKNSCKTLKPKQCYMQLYRRDCCYTCKVFKNAAMKSCEYGNRNLNCGEKCTKRCCNKCSAEQLIYY